MSDSQQYPSNLDLIKNVKYTVVLHIFHFFFYARNAQVTLAEKPQMKINSLKKQKHRYLIHTWSDKASKGTVVNLALPFLHGGLSNYAYSPWFKGSEDRIHLHNIFIICFLINTIRQVYHQIMNNYLISKY